MYRNRIGEKFYIVLTETLTGCPEDKVLIQEFARNDKYTTYLR
jgi:hypothetical protein